MWETYYTPTSIDEAVRLLAEHGAEARVIAGGTDLMVELQRGERQARVLVDVSRIGGLDRVRLEDDGLIHVGPAVTHNLAADSELIVERAFPLALSCYRLGTPQLRNRGTIAGNLITASPANDTIPPLFALEAQVTLRSERGDSSGGSTLLNLIEEIEESAGEIPLREVGRLVALEAEREAIARMLHHTNWNRKKSARLLGVSYKTLLQKIRGCGLEPS